MMRALNYIPSPSRSCKQFIVVLPFTSSSSRNKAGYQRRNDLVKSKTLENSNLASCQIKWFKRKAVLSHDTMACLVTLMLSIISVPLRCMLACTITLLITYIVSLSLNFHPAYSQRMIQCQKNQTTRLKK